MIIYPAIDIRQGKCVRLTKGIDGSEKCYGDPLDMAKKWIDEGAAVLHVVNLDGAFDGRLSDAQVKVFESIASLGVPVQVGGGIRSLSDVDLLFDAGIACAVIGTAAINNSSLVASACGKYQGRIIVGIDALNGIAKSHGWTESAGVSAARLALSTKELGVTRIVYTDISRDGMLGGANISETAKLIEQTGMEIIGSGGVGSLDDITAFKRAGCYGAIVGKALYENKFTLNEAIKAAVAV
ncbi:MAG: 1-(5-phosphoribosyl)-5-[(5-phosphoribosylamino)methylideneamino]imidazole-4-carboxamide isomerase [Oscillospiraceae bacterium]|jgi:phosphoribosylformimino-5-aminoimidazole carboxamide ribotide isomerase|nr:1-(5-phosphoribosyl)-5-[(5-phosphoribosylamino)methylideneamino]imidazole-4-carboxamide isomerase [Oscillospiraceae bacterium]